MILIDPNNPKATKIHAQLSDLTDLSKLPFHLVFGGDGWMLQCIREYGHTVISLVSTLEHSDFY